LSKSFCQNQDQDQYFTVCPRGASRPRLWSRRLHHWCLRRKCTKQQFIHLLTAAF